MRTLPSATAWSAVAAAAAALLVAPSSAPAAERSGGAHAQLSRSATPRCFGAAARDPRRPCDNRRRRLKVTPTPDEALLTPNLACRSDAVSGVVRLCAFGLPAAEARETVAVVGDSHAAHWRAALAVVARAKRWRVVELGTPHCPFSLATPDSGPDVAAWCPAWNQGVLEWLAANPELRTVFMSANARAPIVVPRGRTELAERVDGYVRAWQLLPASVQRIIVLRDVPMDRTRTQECVRRAIARRKPAGRVCAVPRRSALPPDAEVAAAKRLRARGARVVDLTRHFCGRRHCFPVVGGVLVHRDADHLTQLFARTLGPFVLRRVNRLLGATASAR